VRLLGLVELNFLGKLAGLAEVEEEHVNFFTFISLVSSLHSFFFNWHAIEEVFGVSSWNENARRIEVEVDYIFRVDELECKQNLLGNICDLFR